jgi:hypothetical protein
MLYSADLSKATDYIPHDLAQFVANELCDICGYSESRRHILKKMLGAHKLPDGRITTNGIHMGLGPAWTILCLLNGFAAWYAGASKEDHQICGDDLIGLWPQSTQQGYESTLQRLGLVVNQEKSYKGSLGVFCERIVQLDSTGTEATVLDVGHLSAATAAKYRTKRSHARLSVADQLFRGTTLQGISRQTAIRLSPRMQRSGPLRLGGNGTGLPTIPQIAAAVDKGAVQLVKPDPLPQKRRDALSELKEAATGIKSSDLLLAARTRLRVLRISQGKEARKTEVTSASQFKRLSNAREQKYKKITRTDLLTLIKHSELTPKDKKTALFILHNRIPSARKGTRLTWLARIVSRPRHDKVLEKEEAIGWLSETCNLPWGWVEQSQM